MRNFSSSSFASSSRIWSSGSQAILARDAEALSSKFFPLSLSVKQFLVLSTLLSSPEILKEMTYLLHRRLCFVRSHGSGGSDRGRVFRHDHKAPSPHYPASPLPLLLHHPVCHISFTATPPPSLHLHNPTSSALHYHTSSTLSLLHSTIPTTTAHHLPFHYYTSSSLPLSHLTGPSSATPHHHCPYHTSSSFLILSLLSFYHVIVSAVSFFCCVFIWYDPNEADIFQGPVPTHRLGPLARHLLPQVASQVVRPRPKPRPL